MYHEIVFLFCLGMWIVSQVHNPPSNSTYIKALQIGVQPEIFSINIVDVVLRCLLPYEDQSIEFLGARAIN